MTEYRRRIINRLSFRIMLAIIAIGFLTGVALYIYVLRPISDFVEAQMKDDLLKESHEIYAICDRRLNELLKTGLRGDEPIAKTKKGLTIGEIEDFMRQNGLEGSVRENGRILLTTDGFPPGLSETLEKSVKENMPLYIGYGKKRYYANYLHFSPWDWHIVLIKDTAQYSAILEKARHAYIATGAIFFLMTLFSLYMFNRTIQFPLNSIISMVNACNKPQYKGIYEFEFLSDNIRHMMDALEKEAAEKEEMREHMFQSQKMEAVGKLAGGIAHDFNNLLQGILGYASLIKMKIKEDDSIYKSVDIIEKSALKAAELTKQLLGFARRGKYVIEPINLNEVIGDVLRIIGHTFDRAIEIRSSLDDNLWTVEVDRNQIENAILNSA